MNNIQSQVKEAFAQHDADAIADVPAAIREARRRAIAPARAADADVSAAQDAAEAAVLVAGNAGGTGLVSSRTSIRTRVTAVS